MEEVIIIVILSAILILVLLNLFFFPRSKNEMIESVQKIKKELEKTREELGKARKRNLILSIISIALAVSGIIVSMPGGEVQNKELLIHINVLKDTTSVISKKLDEIAATLGATTSRSQTQQLGSANQLTIIFQGIIYSVGVAFSGFCAFWCFSRLIHRIFRKKTDSKIRPEGMPILQPIPIPTKDRNIFAQLLVWIIEPRRWRVMEDWCYPFEKKNGKIIKLVIPKGFEFDGASIPRVLWFFLHPTGLLLIPGLIHDYGYKYDQLWKLNANGDIVAFPKPPKNGRLYWDSLFRKIGMQVNGVWLPNILAWLAVVFCGRSTWRKHKKGGRKKAKKPQTAGQCSPSQQH